MRGGSLGTPGQAKNNFWKIFSTIAVCLRLMQRRLCCLVMPNKENLQIGMRPATADDLDFLVGVFLSAGREMITASRGSWDATSERVQFEEQLDLSSTRVIRSGTIDVGFIMLVTKAEDVELHTICVLPEHQGLGIGSRITNEVVQSAAESGRGVVLSVLKENKRARALYERLGFVVAGESKHHDHMRFNKP